MKFTHDDEHVRHKLQYLQSNTAQKLLTPIAKGKFFPCLMGAHDGMEHAAKRTMLPLNQTRRAMLVDKVPDVANLAVGALSFGQFLAGRPFSLTLALCGVGMWMALIVWTLVLATERNEA